ncbi:MAG TPA: agmatine deiminase family protein [Rhizomicrobium sp.]
MAERTPALDGYRMPPEWARHSRTWMCWPCRIEAWGSPDGLARAKQATARVAAAIARFEPVTMATRPQDAAEVRQVCGDTVEFFETPLDDSWARDIGPSFLSGPGRAGVAWRFNAWGGKYHPFENDSRFAARILEQRQARLYRAPLVCEGGAIHVDGEGTLLTTEQCLLNPNRNPQYDRAQIEETLKCHTGVERIVWIAELFLDEETDGHIDNIACFAAPGRVILGIPASRSHPDFPAVEAARARLASARDARGRPFEIVEIGQPRGQRTDWRGRSLAASYVNFYLANGAVIIPAFDNPADEPARAVLAACFPDREIVQVDARAIVDGGGGIHCITQQEPA